MLEAVINTLTLKLAWQRVRQNNGMPGADDFIVQCQHQQQALNAHDQVLRFLERKGLELNQDKSAVVSFAQGFHFLGHSFINEIAVDDKSQQLLDTSPECEETLTEQPSAEAFNEQLNLAYQQLDIQPILNRALFDDEPEQGEFSLPAEDAGTAYTSRIKTLYVTQHGAVLSKRGHRILVHKSAQLLKSVPAQTLDLVILMARAQLTVDVHTFCLQHQIPIVYANGAGHFYGITDSYQLNDARLTVAQAEHSVQLSNQLALARILIRAKLNNSLVVLRRQHRTAANAERELAFSELEKQFKRLRNRIEQIRSLNRLRGIEGMAARLYFARYRTLLPEPWQFSSRNRRPPQDPVNLLLSLGYSVLFNNLYCFIKSRGLHAHLGYLHAGYNGQPALALDLMEPYRAPVIDALVLKLLNHNAFSPDDFGHDGYTCTITHEARKRFFDCARGQTSEPNQSSPAAIYQ